MVKESHPFWELRSQLRKPQISLLEFSRYVYREYGVTESRTVFQVPPTLLTEKWLDNQIGDLGSEEELAVHSRMVLGKEIYHLPMIDFVNALSIEEIRERTLAISKSLEHDIWIYNSGRSLHGYYFTLLDQITWQKFLGELLLCNSRGKFPSEVVDSRWVGHSLQHGFSALRWSQNTTRHQSLPALVHAGIEPAQYLHK
jgi:hypothetical protein